MDERVGVAMQQLPPGLVATEHLSDAQRPVLIRQAASIVDGQPVVVRTERGHLTGTAKVDPAIRRGVVSVPHGHHGANVNALTDKDVIDPVTGMVRYSCVPVSVEPAAASDA